MKYIMIGIVRYGAGNIFSLTAALERLGISYGMINKEEDFEFYDRYIIPGVGHAGAAMSKLESTGLVPFIKALKKTCFRHLCGHAVAYFLLGGRRLQPA